MNVDNMTIEQLEIKLNKLYNKKMNIARKAEQGKISTGEAELKYAETSKLYNECYIKLEKMKSESYDRFINAFKIGDK